MKLEQDYLSKEELEKLMIDIEENDLVLAPPDLLTNILCVIEEEIPKVDVEPKKEIQNNRVIEFRKYCIQVITSVAAAIALVFLLPTSIQVQKTEIPSKDMIMASQTIRTKADVLEDNSKEIENLENFLSDIKWFHIFK